MNLARLSIFYMRIHFIRILGKDRLKSVLSVIELVKVPENCRFSF